MTLTGAVDTFGESLSWRDLTATGVDASFRTTFVCERYILDDTTVSTGDDGYAVELRNSWVVGGDVLDDTFAPPRPSAGSPAVDAAGAGATAEDFWGLARTVADIGAVER